MPKQKQNTRSRKPVKRIMLIVTGIVVFLLIGYWVTKSVNQYYAAQKQKTGLVQSLEVIKSIYNEQVKANSSLIESKNEPENRCSEISSKSLTSVYSCGSRSFVALSKITESDADKASAKFIESMSQAGGLKKIKVDLPFESSILKSKTTSLTAFYADTDINCHGTSTYKRDEQRLILSFGCTDRDKFQPFPLLD